MRWFAGPWLLALSQQPQNITTNPMETMAVEKCIGGSLSGDTSAVSCCFLRPDFESVSDVGFFLHPPQCSVKGYKSIFYLYTAVLSSYSIFS